MKKLLIYFAVLATVFSACVEEDFITLVASFETYK